MTCIRPAGRRGACSCGNQYAQILDRLDTVEQEASDAKTTAQTAANTASIQAANAAADAAQAASDAGDALTQATAAAASAAAAALDAGNAAADLASINSTISSTLTTYLGTKVDKLTTTGSFAYTHTNATQGETALVDGTTGNTIPIRDASGYLKAASPATGVYDTNLVNGTKVKNELDNYSPMVRTTGNQTITGVKTFTKPISFTPGDWHSTYTTTPAVGDIVLFAQLKNQANGRYIELEFMQSSNTAVCRGELGIFNTTSPSGGWFIRKAFGSNNPLTANSIVLAKDGNGNIYLGCRRTAVYGGLYARVAKSYNYGAIQDTPSPYIEWLSVGVDIGDGTGYTLTEMTE